VLILKENAVLSKKENFMRVLRGEVPEYVPEYNIFWGLNRPSVYRERRNPDGSGFDMFGVEYVIDGSSIKAALPKPGVFILDDIRRWRDVIKMPDYSYVDWEKMAKKDIEKLDPELPRGGSAAPSGGFFQTLVAFMGFTEGLIACCSEPDEVKALMEYLADIAVDSAKKFVYYYKPDYGFLADDIAHERNPFVSLEMFRELFAPAWRRYINVFLEAGLPAMHHNCGHFEEFLDDIVDMGFNGWDPVQPSNDADAIKQKYGNKLALCGGFDPAPFLPIYDGVTEEEVRAAVKDLLDRLAPGGGYAFSGAVMGDSPVAKERSAWILDEFEKLRYNYY
jgi:hypothetical protein